MSHTLAFNPSSTVNFKWCYGLRVLAGEFENAEFAVRSERFVVGRGERCDLRFHAQHISRAHCVFVPTVNGLMISDLHSRNGTRVNGMPILRSSKLKVGDRIAIGSTVMLVVLVPLGLSDGFGDESVLVRR